MSRRLVPLTEAHTEWPWASQRYLRRLVAGRKIQFFKVAGRVWLDAADLDAHQEAGRCEPFAARDPGRVRARRLTLSEPGRPAA